MSRHSGPGAVAGSVRGYVSTRSDGSPAPLGFGDVLLAGLAPDGGLYCPVEVPALPHVGADTPYVDAAVAIMEPYTAGTFDAAELEAMADAAYRSFRDPDVCPVLDLGPATRAVGHDPSFTVRRPHRGQESEFAHRHRRGVVLGMIAERPRHPAAA